VTGLEFLSPGLARPENDFEPIPRSPLEHALRDAPAHIRDLSGIGKLDVRGGLDLGRLGEDVEVVAITPDRALVLCPAENVARHLDLLGGCAGTCAPMCRASTDVTSALAGLGLEGEQLLRRLTDLDLDALPATGAVARVPGTLLREGDEFRLFFPQEYAVHVADVVLDAAAGLR